MDDQILLFLVLCFCLGFASGFGVRAMISRHRRSQVRKARRLREARPVRVTMHESLEGPRQGSEDTSMQTENSILLFQRKLETLRLRQVGPACPWYPIAADP